MVLYGVICLLSVDGKTTPTSHHASASHPQHHAVSAGHHALHGSSDLSNSSHSGISNPPLPSHGMHSAEDQKVTSTTSNVAGGLVQIPGSTGPNMQANATSSQKGSLVRRFADGAISTIVDGTLGTAMNSAQALADAGQYAVEGTKNVVVGAKDVVGGLVSIGGDVKGIVVAAGKGAVNVAKDLTRSRKNPTPQTLNQASQESDIDALIADVGQPLDDISTESLGIDIEGFDPSLTQSTSRMDDVLGDIKGVATDIKNNVTAIASKAGDVALNGLTAGADATHAFSGAAGAIMNDPLLGRVARNTVDTAANTVIGVGEALLSDVTVGVSTVILKDLKTWVPDINASDVVSQGIDTLNTASGIVAESLHEKKEKRDKKRLQENTMQGESLPPAPAQETAQVSVEKGSIMSNIDSMQQPTAPLKTNVITDQALESLLNDINTVTPNVPEPAINLLDQRVAVAPVS